MRSLWVALGFLTRLPTPRTEATAADFAGAVRLYPLVGVLVGALVAAAGWLGGQIDPWFGGTAALATWVWVTGALHLDGLGDVADGLGAAHGDRERLLAVMADPHVGSFGVVAIVLQLLAKLVLLRLLLPEAAAALVAIPAAARIAPLVWARWLPALRPRGLGAAIAAATRLRDVIGWAILLVASSLLLPPLGATPVIVGLLYFWIRRRLGGITGDVHGAGVELTETALLATFLVARFFG